MSTQMIRTQVYLSKDLYQEIDVVAKQRRQPKAAVIRDLVDAGLQQRRQERALTTGEALLAIARLGEKLAIAGPADMSTNLDHYLYEEDNS